MRNKGWIIRLTHQQLSVAMAQCIARCCGFALALMMTGAAVAQNPNPEAAKPGQEVSAPNGYTIHHSVDLGGHIANVSGSNAMYDTLVNEHSGPRVLGETVELHALPGNKDAWLDDLKAFTTGFGGDPLNVVRMNASKKRLYEFNGMFRRDRSYFDYDLLGNPNMVPSTLTNTSGAAGSISFGNIQQSTVLFNTVRHMLDTNLTILPQNTFTFRVGYSHGTMQGPTRSPSYTVGKYKELFEQFQRNGTEEYTVGVDWKPARETTVSIEEIMNRYKDESYWTLDPALYQAVEANGTPVYLGNIDVQAPYNISSATTIGTFPCATTSMGSAFAGLANYTILSPSTTPGGLPVINPACSVVSNYQRREPSVTFTPTSILRFVSSAIPHFTMNGDIRYTLATMRLPSYFEQFQGLDVAGSNTAAAPFYGIRQITYTGNADAHRAVVSADYGFVWEPMKSVIVSDQLSYSNVHEPGFAFMNLPAALITPTDAFSKTGIALAAGGDGNVSINTPLSSLAGSTTAVSLPHGVEAGTNVNFFGQNSLTNKLTAAWDVSTRVRLSLSYRYLTRTVEQGIPHNIPIPNTTALSDPVSGNVTINENAGILNVALRPTSNWQVNGSAEISYDDNALTPVAPRQLQRYRIHSRYRFTKWATLTAAYNDLERHNNTNNNAAYDAATSTAFYGPINHVDYSRNGSLGAEISPNEHYGVNIFYAFSDVYTATNICYSNGAAASAAAVNNYTEPGAVSSALSMCSSSLWAGRDFSEAPTNFGSASLMIAPVKEVKANFGYNVSNVNGTRFYNDARDVAGSMASRYQTPFANVAYSIHPGLIVKADFHTYNYGESSAPSGSQYCTMINSTASIVPCSSLSVPTGVTEGTAGLTAPRTFRASTVTLGIHYEF